MPVNDPFVNVSCCFRNIVNAYLSSTVSPILLSLLSAFLTFLPTYQPNESQVRWFQLAIVQPQAPSVPGQLPAPISVKLTKSHFVEHLFKPEVLLDSSVRYDVDYPDTSADDCTRNQVKSIAQIAQTSGWLNILGKDVQEYAGDCFGPAKPTHLAGELSVENMHIWRREDGNHFRIQIHAQWKPMQSTSRGGVSSRVR